MARTGFDPNDWMSTSTPAPYEETLIETMWEYRVSLAEAIYMELQGYNVDTSNVYDVVDFLEERLENLDKVQYYMQVYTGQQPDVILRRVDDGRRPGAED